MVPPIGTEGDLEAALSEPTPEVIETFRRLPGDIMLLGVGGKMGLSLARMARRAADAAGVSRRVLGVSRFSGGGEAAFHVRGVETIRCDLLNDDELKQLPDAANIVFMTGKKFGSTDDMASTWAMNCHLPARICDRFRDSRIVAFSTGNVYGLTPVSRDLPTFGSAKTIVPCLTPPTPPYEGGEPLFPARENELQPQPPNGDDLNRAGSIEEDPLEPVGEYAMSCLGRERVFEYFSRTLGISTALVRLNYACDLRYGVLVDLARLVWNEQPVDLTMGYFNTIWQGDANAQTLRAFDLVASPLSVVNVTGPELLSVRAVCEQFGRRWQKPVHFVGIEADTALLSNTRRAVELFGPPRVSAGQLVEMVADWVARGGRSLGKPTHFESRSGRF